MSNRFGSDVKTGIKREMIMLGMLSVAKYEIADLENKPGAIELENVKTTLSIIQHCFDIGRELWEEDNPKEEPGEVGQ